MYCVGLINETHFYQFKIKLLTSGTFAVCFADNDCSSLFALFGFFLEGAGGGVLKLE